MLIECVNTNRETRWVDTSTGWVYDTENATCRVTNRPAYPLGPGRWRSAGGSQLYTHKPGRYARQTPTTPVGNVPVGSGAELGTSVPKSDNKSDGSSASYYKLPEYAEELHHLISYKNMSAAMGEIFRAAYRSGEASHSDDLRDIRKIIAYGLQEQERILRKRGEYVQATK